MRELQKMPEGVEIKPKITKGGKGAKKRKADGSVRPLCSNNFHKLMIRTTTRLALEDRVIVMGKRSRRSVHLVKKPRHESKWNRKKSRVRSER